MIAVADTLWGRGTVYRVAWPLVLRSRPRNGHLTGLGKTHQLARFPHGRLLYWVKRGGGKRCRVERIYGQRPVSLPGLYAAAMAGRGQSGLFAAE